MTAPPPKSTRRGADSGRQEWLWGDGFERCGAGRAVGAPWRRFRSAILTFPNRSQDTRAVALSSPTAPRLFSPWPPAFFPAAPRIGLSQAFLPAQCRTGRRGPLTSTPLSSTPPCGRSRERVPNRELSPPRFPPQPWYHRMAAQSSGSEKRPNPHRPQPPRHASARGKRGGPRRKKAEAADLTATPPAHRRVGSAKRKWPRDATTASDTLE